MGYIYLIRNKVNDKKYIGKTVRNYERRWYEHLYYAEQKGTSEKSYAIQKAIKKYGKENFDFSLVEEAPNSQLGEKERYYIKKYDTYIGNGKGYNMTLGGEGTIIVDREAVKKKWEEGKCCREIALDLKSSTATISSIVLSIFPDARKEIHHRGAIYSTRHLQKSVQKYDLNGKLVQTYSSLKETGEPNIQRPLKSGRPNKGYFWINDSSPYSIEEAVKRYRENPNLKNKKVAQYSKEGELIKIFPSISSAKKETLAPHISDVCNGRRKSSGGYIWKYYSDNE